MSEKVEMYLEASRLAQLRSAASTRDGQDRLASLYLDVSVSLHQIAIELDRQTDKLLRIQGMLHRAKAARRERNAEVIYLPAS